MELLPAAGLSLRTGGMDHAGRARLAGHERRAVGHAYAIASNYLRRTGTIADSLATDRRLLEIIVQLFERGEFNKIRLANKAIAEFESEQLV